MKTTQPKDPLKALIAQLSGPRAHEIRTAYYQAAAGLATLAEELEKADAEVGGETELLTEHYRIAKIEELFNRCPFGKIL
jgi:hypothetical protein